MIRLQIINLLPPHHAPNVLAQKLYDVQLMVVDIADRTCHAGATARVVLKAWAVAAEAFGEALSDAEAQALEADVDAVSEDGGAGKAVGG